MSKSILNSPAFIIPATLVTTVLGYFGYKKITKKVQQKKQENTANSVDAKDPKKALASQLAQKSFTAFFPSGYPGLWDGTDETALYEVAAGMFKNKVPFAYLTEAYRKLYNRAFAQDLAEELDSTEITKFYNLYKLGKSLGSTSLI